MKRTFLLSLVLLLLLVIFVGCRPQVDDGINLACSWDLALLVSEINDHNSENGLPLLSVSHETDNVGKLNADRSFAVLLGREPTSEELKGFQDYIIAYDAVCLILDENSFKGGSFIQKGGAVKKTSGLRDLTTDELREIFSFQDKAGWLWNGEHYIRDPGFDRNSWLFKTDYGWTKSPASISCQFVFPPGQFDTQTVLYNELNLDENLLKVKFKQYPFNAKLKLEEEILATHYKKSMYYSKKYGSQDYSFGLGFASRRVMPLALKNVPVKVLSINGINPLEDTNSIYDGTYPFARKVHLLIPENSSPMLKQLTDYLLSPDGQQLIQDAGYLPLKLNQ